jgi:hypothetical protein
MFQKKKRIVNSSTQIIKIIFFLLNFEDSEFQTKSFSIYFDFLNCTMYSILNKLIIPYCYIQFNITYPSFLNSLFFLSFLFCPSFTFISFHFISFHFISSSFSFFLLLSSLFLSHPSYSSSSSTSSSSSFFSFYKFRSAN